MPRQLGRGETVVPHSPSPVSTLYKEKRNERGQQKPEAVFELSVLLSQADSARRPFGTATGSRAPLRTFRADGQGQPQGEEVGRESDRGK